MAYNYWTQGQPQQNWYANQNYGWGQYNTQQPAQAYAPNVQMGQSYPGFQQGQVMQSYTTNPSAPPSPPPPPPPPPPPANKPTQSAHRQVESPPPPPPPPKKPALSQPGSNTPSTQTESQAGGHGWRAGIGFQKPPPTALQSYTTSQNTTSQSQSYGNYGQNNQQGIQSYQQNQTPQQGGYQQQGGQQSQYGNQGNQQHQGSQNHGYGQGQGYSHSVNYGQNPSDQNQNPGYGQNQGYSNKQSGSGNNSYQSNQNSGNFKKPGSVKTTPGFNQSQGQRMGPQHNKPANQSFNQGKNFNANQNQGQGGFHQQNKPFNNSPGSNHRPNQNQGGKPNQESWNSKPSQGFPGQQHFNQGGPPKPNKPNHPSSHQPAFMTQNLTNKTGQADNQTAGSRGMTIGEQIRVGFSTGAQSQGGGAQSGQQQNQQQQQQGDGAGGKWNPQNKVAQYKNLQGSFKSSGQFVLGNKQLGPGTGDGAGQQQKMGQQKWAAQQKWGGQQRWGNHGNKKPASQRRKEDQIRRTIKRDYPLKSGAARVRYEYPESDVVPDEQVWARKREERTKQISKIVSEIAPKMEWPPLPDSATEEERIAHIIERITVDKEMVKKGPMRYITATSWACGVKCTFQFKQVRPPPKTLFQCEVFLNDLKLGFGEASNKKGSKIEAFHKVDELLKSKTPEEIVKTCPRSTPSIAVGVAPVVFRGGDKNCFKESNFGNICAWRKPEDKWPLSDFVILDHLERIGHELDSTNATSIMRQSADFSRMLLEYHITYRYQDMTDEEIQALKEAKQQTRLRKANKLAAAGLPDLHPDEPEPEEKEGRPQRRFNVCKIFLEGICLGEVEDSVRQRSKLKASEIALESIKETNYTILIKKIDLDIGVGVRKAEVFTDASGTLSEYSEFEGWGARIMRKWGWMGGGLGPKNNQGIEMPVDVIDIWGKEGLGARERQHDTETFHLKLQDYLNDFALQNQSETLIFSPEFTKPERGDIHNMAQRLSLKAQTVFDKKSGNTYVIVTRRVSGQEILKRLKELGGHSQKYDLKPPLLAEFMGDDV